MVTILHGACVRELTTILGALFLPVFTHSFIHRRRIERRNFPNFQAS